MSSRLSLAGCGYSSVIARAIPDGHPFITVIAYQLVQVIRRRLRENGECGSWTTIRRILEGQQRVTATFRCTDGRILHVRKATRAEPPSQAIDDAPGIGPA